MGNNTSGLGLSDEELRSWKEQFNITPQQANMVLSAFKKQKEKDGKMGREGFVKMMFKVGK